MYCNGFWKLRHRIPLEEQQNQAYPLARRGLFYITEHWAHPKQKIPAPAECRGGENRQAAGECTAGRGKVTYWRT